MSYGQNPFADPKGNPYQQNPYQQPNYGPPGSYGQPNYNQPNYGQPRQSYPPGTVKNYLLESILAMVFCGHLIAIPAVIFASQVDGKLSQGDYHGAVEASNNAKLWLTIAVSVGVICNLGGCFCVFLGALADAAT